MKQTTFRTRLKLSIGGLILASMTALLSISYFQTVSRVRQIMSEQLSQTTEVARIQVNDWLRSTILSVKIQAERNVIKQALLIKNDEKVTNTANDTFQTLSENRNEYETMGLIAPDGMVLASNDKSLVGKQNLSERAYFKSSMDGKSAISDVLISKATGNPIFVVSEPVKIENKVAGVVFFAINLEKFYQENLSTVKPLGTGYSYLVDRNCIVIAHPDKANIGKTNICDLGFGNEMKVKKNGYIHYEFKGVAKTAGFSTDEQSGWMIGLTLNDSDFSATIAPVRNTSLVLGFIFILLGMISAKSIADTVYKQFGADPEEIVRVVNEIAAGNLNTQLSEAHRSGVYEKMRQMLLALKAKQQFAHEVSEGNLRASLIISSEQDDLGKALNQMKDELLKIVTKILTAAEQIAVGANEVSSASILVSQGATSQAASQEEISSSLSQVASQVQNTAQHATDAATIANKSRTFAEEGQVQIETTVAAMTGINNASQQISKIIKVIDDIAFQTNLLALNATVEAARTGKHGKGFAVVAEEVRSLASRSAKAARETAELIESSASKVENGLEDASKTAATFKEIVIGAVQAAELIQRISAASSEQAASIQEVNIGMNQISNVTQQTTASVEKTAAAAEELSSQAQELRQLLQRFRC